MVSPELLEILACPLGKVPLKLSDDGQELMCETCGLRYSIQDDIPVLILEEAKLPEGVASLDDVVCNGRSGKDRYQ